MPADAPKTITFPCPACKQAVDVPRADRKAVRRAGKGGGVLVVRVECQGCQRVIVRTMAG